MAIKNFLFTQKSQAASDSRVVLAALIIFAFAGCSRGQKHTDSELFKQDQKQGTDTAAPESTSTVVPVAPEGVQPVGVFLSAGGLRSFAHIGVLRVLRRAQVPVVAVSGVEWGALVAGIYSQSKGLNDVEWQMMKLRADQLPTKGLITRNFAARDSKELFQFTRFVFNEKRVESGASSFFCPTAEEDNVVNIGEGLLKDEILKCTVMPPLYAPVETGGHKYISGAVNPGDWVGELKRRGAKFIVYVDVISRGKYFTQNYANENQIKALWSGVRATSKAQQPFAQAVIEVPLDMDLNDFETRRDAIAAGERAAVAQLNMILKNIGATH